MVEKNSKTTTTMVVEVDDWTRVSNDMPEVEPSIRKFVDIHGQQHSDGLGQ